MTRVAFIGLGEMGSRMARRLVEAGNELTVWNRTRERAQALGAVVADTPAEAVAGAEVAITMVADPAALAAVTEEPEGVAAGARQGTTVIEMSTVGPAAIRRLAQVLDADLLDAPVLAPTPLGAQAERRRAAIESGEFPARFPLPLALKDAGLIQELELDLPLNDAARSWLEQTEDDDRDYSAVLERITRP